MECLSSLSSSSQSALQTTLPNFTTNSEPSFATIILNTSSNYKQNNFYNNNNNYNSNNNYISNYNHNFKNRNKNNYNYKNYNSHNDIYCCNCGEKGHVYRKCSSPITSLGIICVKYDKLDIRTTIFNGNVPNNIQNNVTKNDSETKTESVTKNESGIKSESKAKSNNDSNNDINTNLKFLLVCRKNSMGYVEFIRGKYPLNNLVEISQNEINYLHKIFNEMTNTERNLILTNDIKQLWNDLWVLEKGNNLHKSEYDTSKKKFMALKEGIRQVSDNKESNKESKQLIMIEHLVNSTTLTWETPEWGFPKGRRNLRENDIDCAKREFQEETNFTTTDYSIINIDTIDEVFTGSNNVCYKHTYFIGQSFSDKCPKVSQDNKFQQTEISDIKWFTYEEAMNAIRPYSTEKRKILTIVFNSLKYLQGEYQSNGKSI